MDTNTFKVLIEVPQGTVNNKYEYDHKTGKMVLDFVFTNLVWPFNYGEVVGTLGGDGDALDAIVFSTEPLEQSSLAECRPFGVLLMLDRGEIDDKIFFVPANDRLVERYRNIEDFTEQQRQDLAKFYAEIARQKNKIIEIKGYKDKKFALDMIKSSV